MSTSEKGTLDNPQIVLFYGYEVTKNHLVVYGLLIIAFLQSFYFVVNKPLARRGYVCIGNVCKLGILPPILKEAATSNIVSTFTLFVIRATIAMYTIGVGIYQIFARGWFHLRFYTVWNWWILASYFSLSALASFKLLVIERQRKTKKEGVSGSEETYEKPAEECGGKLSTVCHALFSITSVTVVIVDTVTWLVLVPMLTSDTRACPESRAHFTDLFYSFLSYNQHAWNALFFLIDFVLNNQPFRFYALGYVGFWSAIFAVWAQLVHAYSGKWLYPFLDMDKKWSVLSYSLLYLVHWIVFALIRLMHVSKEAIAKKLKKNKSKKLKGN